MQPLLRIFSDEDMAITAESSTPPAGEPPHFLRDVAIAALAFAYSIWAIAGSGQEIIAKGFVLLLAGIPIYVGMRWWQQRDAGRIAAELLPLPQLDSTPTTRGDLVAVGAAAVDEGTGHDA